MSACLGGRSLTCFSSMLLLLPPSCHTLRNKVSSAYPSQSFPRASLSFHCTAGRDPRILPLARSIATQGAVVAICPHCSHSGKRVTHLELSHTNHPRFLSLMPLMIDCISTIPLMLFDASHGQSNGQSAMSSCLLFLSACRCSSSFFSLHVFVLPPRRSLQAELLFELQRRVHPPSTTSSPSSYLRVRVLHSLREKVQQALSDRHTAGQRSPAANVSCCPFLREKKGGGIYLLTASLDVLRFAVVNVIPHFVSSASSHRRCTVDSALHLS